MNEDVARAAGQLVGEAIAMEEDFDLAPMDMFVEHYGAEAYERIAKRREAERLKEEELFARTTVVKGDVKLLLQRLRDLEQLDDRERAHQAADQALLDFIGDRRVTALFDAIDKWYA